MERLDENWLLRECPGAYNGEYSISVSGNCMDSNHSQLRIKDGNDLAIKRIPIDVLLHSGNYINKPVVVTIDGVPRPIVKEFVGCRRFAPMVRSAADLDAIMCGKLAALEVALFKYYNPTETLLRIDASKILLAFEVECVLN